MQAAEAERLSLKDNSRVAPRHSAPGRQGLGHAVEFAVLRSNQHCMRRADAVEHGRAAVPTRLPSRASAAGILHVLEHPCLVPLEPTLEAVLSLAVNSGKQVYVGK